MVVGVCKIDLFMPESGSLKAKRQVFRKLIDRMRAKFNAAVAEVGDLNAWRMGSIAFSVVSNDSRHVQSSLDNIVRFVEDSYLAQVTKVDTDILHYEEGIDAQWS